MDYLSSWTVSIKHRNTCHRLTRLKHERILLFTTTDLLIASEGRPDINNFIYNHAELKEASFGPNIQDFIFNSLVA